MKKLFVPAFMAVLFLSATSCSAQADKSKRPSPPAEATATTADGNKITINYSQPALKGRAVGTNLATYGKVWRTGANEATVFEISKDATIAGQALPAGKYGLYTIPGEKEWTVIFSKTWDTWGTNYAEKDDALRVKAKAAKAGETMERFTVMVDKSGMVNMVWGDTKVDFAVK